MSSLRLFDRMHPLRTALETKTVEPLPKSEPLTLHVAPPSVDRDEGEVYEYQRPNFRPPCIHPYFRVRTGMIWQQRIKMTRTVYRTCMVKKSQVREIYSSFCFIPFKKEPGQRLFL